MHKNNQNNQSELKKEPFFPLYSSRCESYDLGRHIRKAKKRHITQDYGMKSFAISGLLSMMVKSSQK